MLVWRSVTLGVMGVNVNINRFHPGEKSNFPNAPAAIQANAKLAVNRLKRRFRD